jgi:hypothetical protein
VGKAYRNFFAGRTAYPQYKKKGKSHESFSLSNDKFTPSAVIGSPFRVWAASSLPNVWRDRYRGSPHSGDDGEPEAGSCGRRCGDGAIAHLLEEQDGIGRRSGFHRFPLVSVHQTLFGLWAREKAHAAEASHLSVFGLWAGD